jgi:hypothetical protein
MFEFLDDRFKNALRKSRKRGEAAETLKTSDVQPSMKAIDKRLRRRRLIL